MRKKKIFCIGLNKTGTTSLEVAFKELGFKVGNQVNAEKIFFKILYSGDYADLVKYCETADVFQDVPFSFFDCVPYLDKEFPESKFILSLRESPKIWYNSLVNFHSKLFGKNGNVPDEFDLKNCDYIKKGFLFDVFIKMYGTPQHDLYNREILIDFYINHENMVRNYFLNRNKDLLIIKLSELNSYNDFLKFIGVANHSRTTFPWENKTI